MRINRSFGLFAILCVCAAMLSAQGLTTTATKDDWEEINFEFNSSILSDGYPSLLRLAELLQQHSDYKVTLDGNADWVGSHRYNDKLSEARADTVKKFLVKYGAAEGQISLAAHGKRQPKVSNETKEGRFMNRRVSVMVADGQGKTVSAGGIREAIRAMQAPQATQSGGAMGPMGRDCCDEVLKRLDKLDEILAALKELKAENDKLKQDVASLQQAQAGVQKQVAELPRAPDKAEFQKMMDSTAAKAIEQNRRSRFALLGLNIGPALNDSFRPGWDRDIKTASKGNVTVTGKGRFFAPFGKDEEHAVQAEGEYMYFPDRQEGQIDLGLVNRWSNLQLGLFNSMKYIQISSLGGGGTLGQGAVTLDYLFKYGRIGLFGTKGYLSQRTIARTPVQLIPGLTTFNIFDETYLRIVDQIGGSTTVGLWKDAYMDANLGALFSHAGSNRPGGMIRLVQPINSMWAFTVEAGLNETMVGPTTSGRLAFGVQLGNWMKPKQFTAVKHAVPVEVPRLRYELLTRRVRTGNSPPVADAGPDQIGVAAGTITLDGSASYDPDGDAITYSWAQIAGPAVSLSAPTAAKTTFAATDGQTYSFRLTVKDPFGAQGTAKVTVATQAAPQVRITQFTANPTNIGSGQSSTLLWQIDNADTAEIAGIGSVNAKSGSTSVTPAQTTTYTLTAHNRSGSVSATATVTVAAQPQAVIVTFQANPASISSGQSSTLTWVTQNADQVSISSLGSVALNGSTSVSPAQTTTYTLTASNKLGQTTASVTVTVSAAPPAGPPTIVSFSANPQQIAAGAQSTLVWQVLNATSVSITSLGTVGGSGSQNVSPAATTTYTLTASNAIGQVTATATVTVLLPAKILSFTATPSTITAGDTVLLSWTTENATTSRIYNIGNVVANGSVQVNPTVDTTYTLYVSGAVGQPSTAQVTVKVNPATPTPKPPVANVGPANIQTNAANVPLDARGSTDPNGLPLTFSWVSANPTATLLNPTSATPIAMLGDNRGDYVFTVTVTNSAGLSSSASVTVTYVHPLN